MTPAMYEKIEHWGKLHQLSLSEIMRFALAEYLIRLESNPSLNPQDHLTRQGLEIFEKKEIKK